MLMTRGKSPKDPFSQEKILIIMGRSFEDPTNQGQSVTRFDPSMLNHFFDPNDKGKTLQNSNIGASSIQFISQHGKIHVLFQATPLDPNFQGHTLQDSNTGASHIKVTTSQDPSSFSSIPRFDTHMSKYLHELNDQGQALSRLSYWGIRTQGHNKVDHSEIHLIRGILFKIHTLVQSISKSYHSMVGSKFIFRQLFQLRPTIKGNTL